MLLYFSVLPSLSVFSYGCDEVVVEFEEVVALLGVEVPLVEQLDDEQQENGDKNGEYAAGIFLPVKMDE